MASENLVILTGKVAKAAQRRFRPDGSPVMEFPLELSHEGDLPDRGGRSLIDIVAFGRLAEFKLNLLQSGQRLRVEGKLKQRSWQTPEGRKRSRVEVIATDLRRIEEADSITESRERGEEDEQTR